MKRDLNCYHIHCGPSPLKPAARETKSEELCTADYDEFCKDYNTEGISHIKLHHGSPKIVSSRSEEKPIHNKENQQASRRHVESANDSGHEDSGYSSFLGLQHELTEHEDSTLLAGNIKVTPNHVFSQRKNLLPVLHFEELVCSTLKKTNRRNPKSWALVLDKVVSKQSMQFTNLIGKSMGLDQLDILGELFHRRFRHLLANILRYLDCMDLINVAKVSTTWKKILQDDNWALEMYNKALTLTSSNNASASKLMDTRRHALHREVFSHVQKLGSAPNNVLEKTSKLKTNNRSNSSSSSFSRHTLFTEIAKTLKNTESLKACYLCGSPAKYQPHLQRATCIREGCGFDFCTKCLCSYHSAKDCTSGKPVKPSSKIEALPGSKKSKQNLRRL
nr:F-box only protein 5-like isoform X2 [Anolis sagrei ordinatus]XP_060609587.1 F-box only protein 5-like isoform X2 [Anolis sagrei ordinatus]